MAYYVKGSKQDNECLTILLKGEINSYTSQDVHNEILDEINKHNSSK